MRGLEGFGWAVFALCSLLFGVSGIVAGDPWVIAGSVAFLVGVVAVWMSHR